MTQRNLLQPTLEVGWREWLALPDFGIHALKVKIDTGARSSSLHVDQLEEFENNQARWVRFEWFPTSRRQQKPRVCTAPVVDERPVTDSSGNRRLRLFIRTHVVIGPHHFEIETNLTSRQNMVFPMLLGRTAMIHRLVVNPGQSYLLGKPQLNRKRIAL